MVRKRRFIPKIETWFRNQQNGQYELFCNFSLSASIQRLIRGGFDPSVQHGILFAVPVLTDIPGCCEDIICTYVDVAHNSTCVGRHVISYTSEDVH